MRREDATEGATLLEQTPVLEAIREERLGRRDLQERFDVSRTTAYRTTVDLEERGLIERTDDVYRLTPHGVAVAAAGRRYAEGLAAAERLRPLLDSMAHPLFVRSLHLFADAEVLTPDPEEPFGLVEQLMDRLASADRYRCLVNTIGPARWFDIAADRAEIGVDMQAVFTRAGLAQIDDDAAERVATALRLPTCRAFVGEAVPFSLNTFDDAVVVVGEDERTGIPNACAVTEREEAWEWAESIFRRYRRAGDPVDPDDLHGTDA